MQYNLEPRGALVGSANPVGDRAVERPLLVEGASGENVDLDNKVVERIKPFWEGDAVGLEESDRAVALFPHLLGECAGHRRHKLPLLTGGLLPRRKNFNTGHRTPPVIW